MSCKTPRLSRRDGRLIDWRVLPALLAVPLVLYGVWLWSRTPATLPDRLICPVGKLNCVAYSPDSAGKYLAAGSAFGNVMLWDLTTRTSLPVELPLHRPVTAVSLSSDGWLIAGGVEQYVLAWEIRSRDVRMLPAFSAPVTSLQNRPRNYELVVGLGDGELSFINTKSAEIESFVSNHKGAVKALAFSPDGTRLVTGGSDGKLVLRNAATRKVLRQIDAHSNEISCVAFAPDGNSLVSGAWDNTVKIWNVVDEAAPVELPHPDALTGVGFANGLVVTGCWDGSLRFWSVAERRVVREFATGEPIHALAIHPRGTEVATVSGSRWLRFWKTPQP